MSAISYDAKIKSKQLDAFFGADEDAVEEDPTQE